MVVPYKGVYCCVVDEGCFKHFIFSVPVSVTLQKDAIRAAPVAVCFTAVGAELCLLGRPHCVYISRTAIPGCFCAARGV